MKHPLTATLILIVLFFLTQVTGLYILNEDMQVTQTVEIRGNETVTVTTINHTTDEAVPRPEVEANTSYIYIVIAVFVGTLLILLLIKTGLGWLWKYWFFIAVAMASSFALTVFMQRAIAIALGIVVAWLKVYKNNPLTHNLSEVLIYTGIAVLFVPLMNLFSVSMLLLIIAVYDMYAVWKSKHMIDLAQFQTKSKLFAGFSVPYHLPSSQAKVPISLKKTEKTSGQKVVSQKVAILGGGDVAFPLLFSGVVMQQLILIKHLTKIAAYATTLIVPIVVTAALLTLLIYAKKDKFYPAMPAVAIGCFIGYGIVWLIV
ncbi:hypothetical protein HZB01_03110 [Candidatus Woesearchaeota archaeon]|nr:hypothetical protein [Candidatus Woesearchaeota archaeon]